MFLIAYLNNILIIKNNIYIFIYNIFFRFIRAPVLASGKLDHLLFMEILYTDNILLISKNIRFMNILFHAVETESTYYGLQLNQSKGAVLNMYGNNTIRFKDGTYIPRENQITYLGDIIIKAAKGHTEVEQRIAATMATWKKMHFFFKYAICPIRWKLMAYNSMLRSKCLYGLETVEFLPALLIKLQIFQIKGLRKFSI